MLPQEVAVGGSVAMLLLAQVPELVQQGVVAIELQEEEACQEVEAIVKRGHLKICSFFDDARTHL